MKKVLLLTIFVAFFTFLYYLININQSNVYKSIVWIDSISDNKKISGTGFVYKIENNKSYILTNYHVIKNSDSILVSCDGKQISVENYKYDDFYDIAILILDDDYDLIPIKDNRASVSINDEITILGYLNSNPTKIKGKVESINQEIYIPNDYDEYYYNAIKFNANINYGNSGSPILDSKNNLVGMVSVMDRDTSIGYAIPADFLMDIANKLEKNKLSRINLGGTFTSTRNIEVVSKYGFSPNVDGVIILEINKNGLIYTSKLEVGDVIVSLNGKKINNVRDLKKELTKYVDYDHIDIIYYRNNKYNSTQINLK